MDDMFWNIPKHEVLKAIRWGCTTLRRRQKVLWFAIAKGGLKNLDRCGTATSEYFYIFSEEELLRFVDFDTYLNKLFTVGPIVMEQGDKFRNIPEYFPEYFRAVHSGICAWPCQGATKTVTNTSNV